MMKNTVTTVAFDADDTLWVNEIYFRRSEAEIASLMKDFASPERLCEELAKSEMSTLRFYGYGIKWFTLSLIDAVLKVSDNKVPQAIIARILEMGRQQAQKPVELLDGVHETLGRLRGRYRLVMATKGDLAEQRRKIAESGVADYFDYIEVMRDKKEENYGELFRRLGCRPEEFLMVGNSLRSDIIPVLETGGYAAHVPSDCNWAHEQVDEKPAGSRFIEINRLTDLLSGELLG